MQKQWLSLLAPPESSPSSLLWLCRIDPSTSARSSALSALSSLLDGPSNKQFLGVADGRPSLHRTTSTRPFTSVSTQLGEAVNATLRYLTAAVNSEANSIALVSACRSIAAIAHAISPCRLPHGLLASCVESLHSRLEAVSSRNYAISDSTDGNHSAGHDSSQLCQALLAALSACLGSTRDAVVDSSVSNGASSSCAHGIAHIAFDASQQTKIRHDAFGALRAMAPNYPMAALKAWEIYRKCAEQFAHERDDKLAVHSLRLIGESLRAAGPHSDGNFEKPSFDARECVSTHVIDYWRDTIRCVVPEALRSLGGEARASAVAIFHSIDVLTLNLLKDKVALEATRICMNSALRDDTQGVRSSASKALGILVTHSGFPPPPTSMDEIAECLTSAASESTQSVRMNAMWALANLASQLGQEVPLLRVESAKAISDCFAQVSWDKDKIKASAMKGLGGLAGSFEGDQLREHDRWMRVLLSGLACGNAKVQCNSCEALNVAMPAAVRNDGTAIAVVECALLQLSLLVRSSTNPKTRAQAVHAMGSLKEREHFGDSFCPVMLSSCEMLHACSEIEPGATEESKRQEAELRRDLLGLVIHLLVRALPSDINGLSLVLRRNSKLMSAALQDGSLALGMSTQSLESFNDQNFSAMKRLGCQHAEQLPFCANDLKYAMDVVAQCSEQEMRKRNGT